MWKNLAPGLTRQRLIIEGTTKNIVEPKQIRSYLLSLAKVAGMQVVSGPFAYSAYEKGYGGWIHWKTSGAHFYSYPTEPSLFSVDLYSCKNFDVNEVVEFTRQYFFAIELAWQEIFV